MIESNTSDFDCSDMNDLKKEISSKSKLVGVTALGRKVMPSIMRYADKEKPLSQLDIGLLKGFYVNHELELMNEQEKIEMKEDKDKSRH